ncbi:splicing factor 45-like [Chrysoperla carnea]|uniref:splicing factor 45-like n=1 Tax=Chrysoperla carnea TaxID=189513 RepID=UPI001D07191C|nr:splicing factor 45-like [Chrysoperla carnea]
MSLYDDYETLKKLPQNQKQQRVNNPSIKFLESHLRSKKALHKSSHNKSAKNISTLAPVIDLCKNNSSSPNSSHKDKNSMANANNSFYLGVQFDWGYEDEYDPAHPCDYFEVRKELQIWHENQEKMKAFLKAEAVRQEILKAKMQQIKSPPAKLQLSPIKSPPAKHQLPKNFLSNYGYDSDDNSGDENGIINLGQSNQHRKRAEIAPPFSLMETSQFIQKDLNTANLPRMGEVVAAKIMAKYGFKEGQGLGKDEQGMSTALQVQRTVRNCGRILHEKDLMPPPTSQNTRVQKSSIENSSSNTSNNNDPSMMNELLKNPSKIVLLSNVVGPGEVDNDLETEIREECKSKYGDVVKVLIFERSATKVADEEAVRVFVEFKRPEQAMKAIVGLNGRYFGGRTIKANFYNVDDYYDYNLTAIRLQSVSQKLTSLSTES